MTDAKPTRADLVRAIGFYMGQHGLAVDSKLSGLEDRLALEFAKIRDEVLERVEPKYRDARDRWYAYECCFGSCPANPPGRTGVVLDLRVSDDSPCVKPPGVLCPFCVREMHYRGTWSACSSGYGSRASPCHGVKDSHLEDLDEGASPS